STLRVVRVPRGGLPRAAGASARAAALRNPSSKPNTTFIAKGEVVIFDGFLKVYGKSKDLELPKVAKGDKLSLEKLTARQVFAKPPARYTEGSLVKKLEELGIGRPSTYASIMTAIQARGYVVKGESEGEDREIVELTSLGARSSLSAGPAAGISRTVITEKYGANKGKLVPTPIGELVSGFLTDNFKNIVDYKFTANIEKDLDLVAEAKLERVKMLKDFYGPFHDTVLVANGVERYNNARLLGHDPKTGKPIYAKVGKNGGFIQLGDNEKESGEKPRFAPLPKRKSVKTVTLEQALSQLELPALPRVLGETKDGITLIAASGPFGPYLKGGKYNIPMKDYDPYTVTFEEALPIYQKKIDSIIADWDEIMIINGAYGPYIKGPGRRNHVKVPKEMDPKKITLEQAREMLENKPKTASKTRRGVRGGRKSSKKTTPRKRTTAKKSTTRKVTAK
ncbi:MAG: DNA topoisomerase, partial [Candidatus Saccharibacteria bacterium]|nr:DNA topoisomerase [Candidatus Saccharibacteria bacterium]